MQLIRTVGKGAKPRPFSLVFAADLTIISSRKPVLIRGCLLLVGATVAGGSR